MSAAASRQSVKLAADELQEIATNAYVYAYPLVLTEITRRTITNVAVAGGVQSPMNQFVHVQAFPDASFTEVVRPNADTLYSMAFVDLSAEPLILDVPDSGGRYYLLQMLDMWSDVFASPGTRTTGTGKQTIALTTEGYSGKLPDGAAVLKAPTAQAWIIGRTRTDGKADYDAVHKFQAGFSLVPLSKYGKPYIPPKNTVNPSQDMSAPVGQVERMSAGEYFALFAQVTEKNPPHANDYPILAQMARLGLAVGRPFEMKIVEPDAKKALESASIAALPKIKNVFKTAGVAVNGWHVNLTGVGTYGTDYLQRAGVAYAGLGANTVEDAIYPTAYADANGKPFDSGAKYVQHFAKAEIPPVRGFWSLTMYDDRQLFTDNALNRYAIGNRDKLKFNADGSLDLYIQRESPGTDKESNWLPAPKSGGFSLNMRLYWPEAEAFDGTWTPPAVSRAS